MSRHNKIQRNSLHKMGMLQFIEDKLKINIDNKIKM